MLQALVLLLLSAPLLAQGQPFDVHALMQLARISDPQVSPDGRLVAFTVQRVELDANKRPSQIYVVAVQGGTPRQITHQGSNSRPRWSPDSDEIAFISDRSGSSQVWLMNANGGNPRQVTSLSTEASGVLFSPDGENLVFTSAVYPECPDDACNQRKLEEEKNSQVKARSYTSLLYRHWDRWQAKRRSHLFVVSVEGGEPRNLTPGSARDVPPFSLGGPDDYAISPDGSELCFVMNTDPEPATSTDSDLFVAPITGGEARKITINPGADNSPAYSPDGRYLAWRMQSRPGYESDRWRLVVLERATGRLNVLTDLVDRWVTGFTWAPDSTRLFFTVEDRGRQGVQMVPVGGGGARTIVTASGHVDDVQLTPDGRTLIYSEQSGSKPTEIYAAASEGSPVPLTRLNDAVLGRHELPRLEEFWVQGAEQTRIHSFMVRPPGFRPGARYPVLFLIHGGPQGAWGETWSYRWNAQVFAAAGYVVVLPNPRGSTGYGQKFVDEINADWGGKPFDDIMAVVDHVEKLPYVDRDRMAAAGASYGGYMVNWILGQTVRFKALVSHAGVFDLRSMFGETEELWFPLWEFRGAPWENPEVYEKWSPSYYVKEFRTPTLVTHGELDYRVPYGQGLQLFTGLQLQKVPSKLLLFPDENHWILKPQNSILWYGTVLDWLGEWLNKPAEPPPAEVTAGPGQPTVQAPARVP